MRDKAMKIIPKSLEDLKALHAQKGLRDQIYDGTEVIWTHSTHLADVIHGRFVPDDMLRERFAFAGSVVLTIKEVLLLRDAAWKAHGNWDSVKSTSRDLEILLDKLSKLTEDQ